MIKPQMPNIPGAGVVTDTLDFVKNLWGSMNVPGLNIPGMVAPTLSVDELDKKIGDLKAVESWLNVNMSMLRGTIQALEIQRGTIATLKSMSATLSAAVKPPTGGSEKSSERPSEKSLLESIPYASAFLFPNAGFGSTPSAAASEAAQMAQQAAAAQDQAQAQAAAILAASIAAELPAKEAGADEKALSMAEISSQLVNPIAWWNVLQDQFKQAVSAAVASDAVAKIGAAGTAIATDAVVKLGEAAANASRAMADGQEAPEAAPPAVTDAPSPVKRKPAAKRKPAV
jgi:hypothetical protein